MIGRAAKLSSFKLGTGGSGDPLMGSATSAMQSLTGSQTETYSSVLDRLITRLGIYRKVKGLAKFLCDKIKSKDSTSTSPNEKKQKLVLYCSPFRQATRTSQQACVVHCIDNCNLNIDNTRSTTREVQAKKKMEQSLYLPNRKDKSKRKRRDANNKTSPRDSHLLYSSASVSTQFFFSCATFSSGLVPLSKGTN